MPAGFAGALVLLLHLVHAWNMPCSRQSKVMWLHLLAAPSVRTAQATCVYVNMLPVYSSFITLLRVEVEHTTMDVVFSVVVAVCPLA